MTLTESIIALVGSALLLVTFAGLLVRGRWTSWYAFSLYLVVVAAFSLAFVSHHAWYRGPNFLLQTNVVNAVRLAMALELGARTFRAFPGARSTLRAVLLILLLATFTVLMAVPTSSHDYLGFLTQTQPRLFIGTVWIFTAIAALILWYRLPVGQFQKSILMPYVPYLVWDATFHSALLALAWDREALGYFNQTIYLALASRWAWVAWRVEAPAREPPDDPPRDPFGPKNALVALLDGR